MGKKEEQIAKQLAEEAIYSAKGHFKTSDWIGRKLFILVAFPFITSSLTLVFDLPSLVVKLLSFFGLVFSMLALVYAYASNQQKAQSDIEGHMDLGNAYLEIYKRIRSGIQLDSLSKSQLDELTKQISSLDKKTNKLKISLLGRWHAKLVLEKEIDFNWMKN